MGYSYTLSSSYRPSGRTVLYKFLPVEQLTMTFVSFYFRFCPDTFLPGENFVEQFWGFIGITGLYRTVAKMGLPQKFAKNLSQGLFGKV